MFLRLCIIQRLPKYLGRESERTSKPVGLEAGTGFFWEWN